MTSRLVFRNILVTNEQVHFLSEVVRRIMATGWCGVKVKVVVVLFVYCDRQKYLQWTFPNSCKTHSTQPEHSCLSVQVISNNMKNILAEKKTFEDKVTLHLFSVTLKYWTELDIKKNIFQGFKAKKIFNLFDKVWNKFWSHCILNKKEKDIW